MKLSSLCLAALFVTATAACGARPASAQTVGPSRVGALFGGAGPDGRHTLDFSVSVVEAHDSDAPAEFAAVDPVAALTAGYSTLLAGTGAYQWQGSRVRVGASGASDFRYFNGLAEIRSVSHTAGVGVSARLGGRSTVFLNQTAAYSPSYLFGLFPQESTGTPGETMATAPDYSTHDSESYAYGTSVSLTRGLSRRSSMRAAGDFQYTDFVSAGANQRDVTSHGLQGDYSRNLARNTALTAGYRYRAGTFGMAVGDVAGDDRTVEHGLAVGLDYSRPLSPTRQFSVSLGVGSSWITGPFGTGDEVARGRGYRFAGDAAAIYQFARGWQARATVRRGLEFVAQLTEPVFVDGLSVAVTGLLTPRMDVSSSVRYASGASALTRTTLAFDTYGADTRLRYGLTRSVATYAQYLYYSYDFTGDTALMLPQLAAGLKRHAFRVGLTVWVLRR